MCAFKSIVDRLQFHKDVTFRTRYRFHPAREAFLAAVQETGRKRMVGLPAESILFRAQLGGESKKRHLGRNIYGSDAEAPYPEKRMKPLPNSAKEGRVNPKGIPCLYLADNPMTAMAEVRPWIGASISLGHFMTIRDLTLMDCTEPSVKVSVMAKATPEQIESLIWFQISLSFSEPVTGSDDVASYASTQVLAEVFREMGCDGVKYRSVVGEGGYSIALFNPGDADLFRCAICTADNIKYTFTDEDRPYEKTVLPDWMRKRIVPTGSPE